MNAVVIGAAKPGYAEAITRKLIKNGFKVIGTYDTEFEENATKLSKAPPHKSHRLENVNE